MSDIDWSNKFFVAAKGNEFVIMRPMPMSADDAIVLAAWLATMAEPTSTISLDYALEAVKST